MPDVKVFVVEDEKIHAKITRISVQNAGYEVVGECDNANEALDAIEKAAPDVVLMDISIPGKINGIGLAKCLYEKKGPPVIFTTSFTDPEVIEQAAASFPASYLIKPIQLDNLKAAMALALAKKTQAAPQSSRAPLNGRSIYIKSGNKLQKVLLKDILWIEAAGDNYCKVVTKTHQLISRHTVKGMVKELNSDYFIQTHRAYVVNRERIDSIHEKEQLVIINGCEVPIGRTYKEELYSQMRRC